jgi:hypothetical protein
MDQAGTMAQTTCRAVETLTTPDCSVRREAKNATQVPDCRLQLASRKIDNHVRDAYVEEVGY